VSDIKQETVIDVLAEMFELADKWCADTSRIKTECLGLIVHRLARRIKEALDRESKIPGNVMALRAALRELRDASRDFYHQILNSKYSGILDKYTCVKQGFPAVLHVKEATVMANLALVAPARNCDVGTAEEQAQRFGTLCNKHYDDEYPCDKKCPIATLDIIHGFPRCQAYWAQLPYSDGTANRGDLCHED
jgi:hypothetical protein